MSMTSKVNPKLRESILKELGMNPARTNEQLYWGYISNPSGFSLRSIQEATQKMTQQGLLKSGRNYNLTYYSIVPQTAVATV